MIQSFRCLKIRELVWVVQSFGLYLGFPIAYSISDIYDQRQSECLQRTTRPHSGDWRAYWTCRIVSCPPRVGIISLSVKIADLFGSRIIAFKFLVPLKRPNTGFQIDSCNPSPLVDHNSKVFDSPTGIVVIIIQIHPEWYLSWSLRDSTWTGTFRQSSRIWYRTISQSSVSQSSKLYATSLSNTHFDLRSQRSFDIFTRCACGYLPGFPIVTESGLYDLFWKMFFYIYFVQIRMLSDRDMIFWESWHKPKWNIIDRKMNTRKLSITLNISL